MANSIRAKMIRDFQDQLYRTCGVRCIILSAYENEDGKIVAGMWVFQEQICWMPIYYLCSTSAVMKGTSH